MIQKKLQFYLEYHFLEFLYYSRSQSKALTHPKSLLSSLLEQVQDRATNMIEAGALHVRGEVKGKGLAQP